jgi:DNA-binding NarL/FixJ family response regulator
MATVYFTTDLIFLSRVQSAARSAGVELITVSSESALRESAIDEEIQLVILDLSAPGCDPEVLVAAIRETMPGARVVAYAPHVLKAKLAAAQAAGCDQVLTRGQFDSQLAGLWQSTLD